MTQDQYHKSIETHELQLTSWGKFSHFSIVGFCAFVSLTAIVVYLISVFQGKSFHFDDGIFLIILIPAILGFLFYLLQKNRLKFQVIQTDLSRSELLKLIDKVGSEQEWSIDADDEDSLIAKTNPNFSSGSWGEQITIVFDKGRVLINSICDPEKRASLVSMGRNEENVSVLIDSIKKAGQTS